MKRILTVLVLFAGFMFLVQDIAYATTFSFGDKCIYWSGWGNGTADDGKDVIGHPDILGGGGTIDSSGNLTDIRFDYHDGGSNVGDVFIDVGADSDWDYVIASGNAYGKGGLSAGVYSVSISAIKGNNDTDYVLSDNFYSGGYREHHPVALSSSASFTQIDFNISVTNFASGDGQVIFSGIDNLSLGNGPFIISFAPTCANDVDCSYVSVPEPATLLLLGLGLFGMGIVSRKRFFAGRKG